MQTFYLLARCQASCARWVLGRVVKQGLRALVLAGKVIAALGNPSHAETISPRRLLEVVDFRPPEVTPDGLRVAFRIEQASLGSNTYDRSEEQTSELPSKMRHTNT